jgi:hypothetical protein
MEFNDLLFIFGVLCLPCLGFVAGLFVMFCVSLCMSGATWRKLRSQSRPFLWYLGLEWPEIKRTFKRSFLIYYGRHLPQDEPSDSPSPASSDGALDESGDVPPGASQQPSAASATL